MRDNGDGTYSIDRLGLHCANDVIVYCAGDQLICWPPDTLAERFKTWDVPPKRLAIDQSLTSKETFKGMKDVIGLSPDAGRVLFAHNISALTRSAYLAAHVTPSAILELIDKHGTFKTTYASFITQLYDRDAEIKPVTRFLSSSRSIEDILYESAECTEVIDDLHPAESRSITKSNEATAEEIVRRIGDNTGRGRMKGNAVVQKNPRGNAVFTGEYTIFKGSTAARSLVISFTKQINPKRLHKCQQQPLLVSTFYFNFINWYVEHYYDIVETLAERLAKHREHATSISPRLWETQFCLQTAYMMFLQYALDKGFISVQTARDEYADFLTLLTSLVRVQNARIEPNKNEDLKDADYYNLIREFYKGDRFRIAKDKDRFDPEKHDGFKNDELLCLRGEKMLKKIQKIVPIATLNDIRDALIAKKAIKLDGEGKNVKFTITKDCKASQLRFYGIYINNLR